MNKLLILFILFFCCFGDVHAQNSTSYYKFVRSKEGSSLGGGQFITFTDKSCYDSDKEGFSVNNGVLSYQGYDGATHTYKGSSYWGTAIYKFNSDKSVLNIILADNTYVYKLSSVPNGVNTSTYIKQKGNSSGSGFMPIQPFYNEITTPNTDVKSGYSPQDNNNGSVPAQRKCVWCNGTGEIVKNDNAPANFGIDKPQQRCNVCGQSYNPNVSTHYHIRCHHCGGTGYVK